jgi:UDP-arabinose 4-epimerase
VDGDADLTAVLVTGGAGFIGSHTCKALAGSGFRPIAYDDLTRGAAEAVRWGALERGALSDVARLRAVVERYRPVGVIHFAAYTDVAESTREPGLYYENNVVGTLRLLQTMRATGLNLVVFSSSAAVYGIPTIVPVTEDAPLQPISPYGASKLMSERMIEDFGRAHGLRWMALRYFNVAGASSDGEIGEGHDPETHLVPRALMAAAGQLECLEVMGTDYPTPDGTAIRDYIHVVDLADAHVLALRRLLEGAPSGAVNLGAGRGHSVREVVRAVEQVTGATVPIKAVGRRPGDPPVLVADTAKAARELDFRAERSDIPGIVESAWRWHQRRPGTETPR